MNRLRNLFSEIRERLSLRSGSRASSNLTNQSPDSLWVTLRSPEVKRKLMITLGILVVYRILAAVPLPGVDVRLFNEAFGNNPLNNFFTIITGGRLDNPSVVAIGLGAYINASIIVQLLTSVIPKLEELSKEGESGRRKINQITRILAVPLTVLQAFVIFSILKSVTSSTAQLAGLLGDISNLDIITMVIALTAGSMILMWLGELITEYGLGNGISILISVSILTVIPSLIARDFSFLGSDISLLLNGNLNVLLNSSFIFIYALIAGFYLLILGIVFVNEATRKVPVQYARRIRGVEGANSNYLPLKLNQAGVMPVIFASALLTFPQIIAQILLSATDQGTLFYNIGSKINNSFLGAGQATSALGGISSDSLYYLITFFILIIAFSYFYTFVTFKPKETAENLQKSGGFIPGIRPGVSTQNYITNVLLRLTFVGSLYLAIVALIPNILSLTSFGSNLAILTGIGGTSVLIIVSVTLDTIRQMKSMTVTRGYELFK